MDDSSKLDIMGAEQSHITSITAELPPRTFVSFMINGVEYIVQPGKDNVGPETLLVDFIRDHAFLKGTKVMCREGGCGICVVSVKIRNAHSGESVVRSVNSCLIPVFACDGWEITTIEHIGNSNSGYHPLQQRMVQFHGSQCGFCTPGWIMNFYSVMESKKQIALADIEDITDGNLCRCTGYRPILDAVKSLAVDAPEYLKRKCGPILPCQKPAGGSEPLIGEGFVNIENVSGVHIQAEGTQWVKALGLKAMFLAIERFRSLGLNYRIVAGNTGTGVYKNDGPYQAFVDLTSIYALQKIEVSASSIMVGGAVTISTVLQTLESASSSEGFEYCQVVCKHWKRVATSSVRNVGTLSGNLMIKHKHREFPSDIFLVLEAIGAMLTICSSPTLQEMCSVQDFLKMNMDGKIIYSIHFPKLTDVQFRTFKITKRYQGAHAYVNAGFLMRVDANFYVKEKPVIVFGGISPDFIHATLTEEFLNAKTLSMTALQGAMETLERECNPDANPIDASPRYRKLLCQSLLYKFIVGLVGDVARTKIKSCSTDIERGPTFGKQTYEFDKSEWPLYEPVKKLEASIQCSGEIVYTNDIICSNVEFQAAILVAEVAKAQLKSVDTSEALRLPGVIAWVDYKDIRGENNYMFERSFKPDAIFAQDKVQYAGQPIGLIVAQTRELAHKAVKMVKVEYENREKPIINIQMALDAQPKLQFDQIHYNTGTTESDSQEDSQKASNHNISGQFRLPGQFHFPMETHVCICVPNEGEMDVHCTTQTIDGVNKQVAQCLGLARNKVNVFLKRLGGAFGNKIDRSAHTACMCAIAAFKVGRTVRISMDLETHMHIFRGRIPYLIKYEAGVDDDGKLDNVHVDLFPDTGCTANEDNRFLATLAIQNAYAAQKWSCSLNVVNTDLPPNTFNRAPGTPQGVASVEMLMEHIAFQLKKDPLEVRLLNLLKPGDTLFPDTTKKFEGDNPLPKMIEDIKMSGDADERQKFIDNFNEENRWKKRGMAIIPFRYPMHYIFSDYKVYLAVYGSDGTVGISHSGIEMGQGINTKVAQVVARKLGIPLDTIKIKPMDSFYGANSTFTGTGATTDHVCHSAIKASELLLEKMKPVKDKLSNPTWQQVAAECKKLGMDLTSCYCTTYNDSLKPYDIWGVCATEVEIDCLTGEYKIVRVDLMSDGGMSLSPDIDVGQVEGAFIMGLGWLLSEKIIIDENTGELLTNRTWNYKPPTAKDIPGDFRVSLLKNAPNSYGVLRSKCLAEAPFVLSLSVLFAMRRAIYSARCDAGNHDWFQLDAPLTPEDIQKFCLTDATQFTF